MQGQSGSRPFLAQATPIAGGNRLHFCSELLQSHLLSGPCYASSKAILWLFPCPCLDLGGPVVLAGVTLLTACNVVLCASIVTSPLHVQCMYK